MIFSIRNDLRTHAYSRFFPSKFDKPSHDIASAKKLTKRRHLQKNFLLQNKNFYFLSTSYVIGRMVILVF